MRRLIVILSFVICHLSFSLAQSQAKVLKGWPCGWEKGYEKGVSACYAGVVNGYLIMAGGANFADKPAAEGGKKCFYKGIYAASLRRQGEQGGKENKTLDSLEWRKAGELPEAMAYGVSVVCRDRLIIIGGSNETGSLSNVYSISIKKGKVSIQKLQSLPIPADNTAGTACGKKLFVGGGMSQGVENRKVFCLDLNRKDPLWEETNDFSGTPSVQAVAFMTSDYGQNADGKPMFLGGFSPKTQDHDARMYAGPSGGALVQLPTGEVYTSGGVNHDIFLDAVSGTYSLIDKKDYLLQPVSWYQFESKLQKYNVADNTYKFVLESSDIARAGAQMVADGRTLYIIGGEIKPGIRINNIIKIKL